MSFGLSKYLSALALVIAMPLPAQQTETGQQVDVAGTNLDLYRLQQNIEAIRVERGVFDPALIENYTGLADLYHRSGANEQALKLLGEALSLARRVDGLNGLMQIPILEQMATVNEATGSLWEAQELQRLKLQTARNHFGSTTWGFRVAQIEYQRWAVAMLAKYPEATVRNEIVEHEFFVWLLDDALRFLEQNQQPLADSAKISLLLETARSRLHIVAAYPWPDSDRLIDNEDGTVSRGGYREFWTRRDSVLETFANLNDNLEAIASILDQSNELDDSIRVEVTSQLAEIESALARTIADQPNIFGAGSLSTH